MCKCCWSGDLWVSAGEKTPFEKTAFKNLYNWNLLTQIDKKAIKEALNSVFWMFYFHYSVKKNFRKNLKIDSCLKKLCFRLQCLLLKESSWLGITCKGERFPHADFATGSRWPTVNDLVWQSILCELWFIYITAQLTTDNGPFLNVKFH